MLFKLCWCNETFYTACYIFYKLNNRERTTSEGKKFLFQQVWGHHKHHVSFMWPVKNELQALNATFWCGGEGIYAHLPASDSPFPCAAGGSAGGWQFSRELCNRLLSSWASYRPADQMPGIKGASKGPDPGPRHGETEAAAPWHQSRLQKVS